MPTMGKETLAGGAGVSGKITSAGFFSRRGGEDFFFMRLFAVLSGTIFPALPEIDGMAGETLPDRSANVPTSGLVDSVGVSCPWPVRSTCSIAVIASTKNFRPDDHGARLDTAPFGVPPLAPFSPHISQTPRLRTFLSH